MKNLNSLALKVVDNRLWILDQTKLPQEEEWLECKNSDELVSAIKLLKVRGAPLIGIAASIMLALESKKIEKVFERKKVLEKLKNSRPTAVNLMNALNRMAEVIENTEMLEEVAVEIFEEDFNLCEAIALNGVDLIQDGDNILTYCNTGGLATSGIGTALGIIKRAHESKKKIHVYVPETRPLLQGARLTAWECEKYKIPFTLICDNMIGTLMKQKKIDKVFVGADRIALNGDFANKIGTYSVSVLAKHHKIPFYVAAPFTTIDFNCKSGDAIPIEERSKDEILLVKMQNVSVYNPAFDVTNGENVTAFILDQGVFSLEKFIETFA